MDAESIPEWLRPPPEGWTAEHLDELPPSAPRMEMIDGALIMMSPRTNFHSKVMWQLAAALRDHAPGDVEINTEMTVKLGRRQRPEPDVIAIRPQVADPEGRRTFFLSEEVVLVVEIVSKESEERDRTTKRDKYAEAGIQHFWLVENEFGNPVIHVLELGTIGAYVETAIARDRLKLDVPFPMDIDVKSLSR
ncbi:Uma2 family endonuclease [Actinomadura sp. 7K507]|nr:Uma2 family endonuclease [Actinomadura sp. 7K507]